MALPSCGVPVTVEATQSASEVLERAGAFLASRPIHHNLILTLLHDRAAHPEPGRYWIAHEGAGVGGVAFQSPLGFSATLTPMSIAAARALVEAISAAGADLPGVSAEAATAAAFAGHWTEIRKTGAKPISGQRLYHLGDLRLPSHVSGRLRPATENDRSVVAALAGEFADFIGEPRADPDSEVLARQLANGQAWLWVDPGPVSLALHSLPVEGVTRIRTVFTPEMHRRRGYASACVGHLSKRLLDAGHGCVLFTDLGNPTSNSVYRRLGYEAVVEILLYRFTEP